MTEKVTAAVSGFYPEPDMLICRRGADAERHFWLNRRGDGSALLVCKWCHQKVVRVTADLMSVE
jgi:hypothetical protein